MGIHSVHPPKGKGNPGEKASLILADGHKQARAAPPTRSPKRVVPFKVDIVFLFCIILIPTVIAVTTYTYKKNSAAALEMSNRLVEKITAAVIVKTNQFHEARASDFPTHLAAGESA